MMSMKRSAVSIAVGIASLLFTVDAHAFLCTRAGGEGPSLAWEPRTIIMHRAGAGAEVDAAEVDRVLEESMLPWNAIECSDIALVLAEPTDEKITGFDWAEGTDGDNENIVVFRNDDAEDALDAWLHQLGALAITTVTFESNQGRLLDADIEVNDASFQFTTCDPEDNDCDVDFDLQNTLTHELGHVLGLDHSSDGDATMFASAPRSDTSKRTLSADDQAAICLVYPSGGPIGDCPTDGGFVVERQAPPNVRFAPTLCGAGAASAPVAILGVLLWSRTRRRRR